MKYFGGRGEPDHIRSDNGPDFANKAVKDGSQYLELRFYL
jgi:hypothetical protein